MKYRKASEVLPDALLREVQKYVSGEALYIPRRKERQKWGAGTGSRDYYQQRNEEIRSRYRAGESMEALAIRYHLSVESIRKILYRR